MLTNESRDGSTLALNGKEL